MKHPISLLAFLVLALTPQLQAAQPNFLVTINGTITFQQIVGPMDGRIATGKVNNDKLFETFGLSKQDYALIFEGETAKVLFRQRNSGGALPDVVVLEVTAPAVAADTKKRIFRLALDVTSPATGNVFEGLDGSARATLQYTGPIASATYKSFTFRFFGKCNHPDPSSGNAIMSFTLKTGAEF